MHFVYLNSLHCASLVWLSHRLTNVWCTKELSPFVVIVTWKSSTDKDRLCGDAVGFSISNFSLGCRLLMVSWNSFAFSSLAVWRYMSSTWGFMRWRGGRMRRQFVQVYPWTGWLSWFVTMALVECAKCHVSDDLFEFWQLRATCLGTSLTESTKYSAWDLGLPEITVYTELVIKRTTQFI